jgi:hypothetical protein
MPAPETLRALIVAATIRGCDPELLSAASEELVGLIVEVKELKRQRDPRKAQTEDLARRVGKAESRLCRNGTNTGRVPLLMRQFGLSRSRIYELLRLSCEPQDSYVLK